MAHKGRPAWSRRLGEVYHRLGQAWQSIDTRFRGWERRHGPRALRYTLAFVFIWYGITKPLAMSPADAVVRPTLAQTPILNELISFRTFFDALGMWETLVGIGLLWRRTVRVAVVCMCIQMAMTFTPLFVAPTETFRWWPLVPSTIGLYIVKNFALATAGLVVAALDSKPLFDASATPLQLRERLTDGIDRRVAVLRQAGWIDPETTTRDLTIWSLQAGLAVVFCWSGLLMVSTSPDPGHWIASIVPNAWIANSALIPLLGVLELAVGLYLLIDQDRATHIAAYLCVGYLVAMMLPVVMSPSQVFVSIPFEPTFEGVYVFKDLILVAGVMTIDAYRREYGSSNGDRRMGSVSDD
jgi:uncharacterized membrane protein YkgB